MTWCELPELPSLRLGRTQPVPRKSGWRLPPLGATTLFADYDRQKPQVVTKPRAFTQPASRINSSFYDLELNLINQYRDQKLTQEKAQDDLDTELKCLLSDTDKAIEFYNLFDESGDEFADLERSLSDEPEETECDLGESLSQLISDPVINNDDLLTYNLMRLPGADNPNKRGKLLLQNQQEVYLELFKQQQFVVTFNVLEIVKQAILKSHQCLSTPLPPGGISVRDAAGSFDYAYLADGRVDVPSDGQFHSVALTSQSTEVNLRYVVVPREDTNVFRIAQLRNPLDAPLLSGSVDVYIDGKYILSTTLPTVPTQGQIELGLGVEQGIKVARNTTYQEKRSSQLLVAFNELRHHLKIDIANRLANEARIEIRERIPVPQEGEKVDVELGKVSPQWHKYEQEEREKPIRGGYRWRIKVPSQQQAKLSAQYTIKTYADNELIGGNRRE
jgi:hypothetical protein